MRVLYFTVVPLGSATNGGSICCRNHVIRLAADPGIELFAMVAGPLEGRESTLAFFSSLGVEAHYQHFMPGNIRHERNSISSIVNFAKQMVFQFPWELQAMNQGHVEDGVAWAIKHHSIDVLVIDYHASALFLRLPRTDARTVMISLNREGDFYADQMRLGQIHHGSLTAGISLLRLRRWERRTDAAVDLVVAIGAPDLPQHPTRRTPICITPYLDPKPDCWRYSRTSRAFFVGAIAHYPNRLAIEWLMQKLAPALLARGSETRIAIVGASEAHIPEQHRHPNVDLLGPSDAAGVAALFQTSDVMLCPVENDFGVKFKTLEALAYGIPLLASTQTMLGLPHLAWAPAIDLEQPDAAAALLSGLIADGEALQALAARQQQKQKEFIKSQATVWSQALGALAP